MMKMRKTELNKEPRRTIHKMSMTSKYPGICKDCKTAFTKGTTIATNQADHWCPHGDKCPAHYSTTTTTPRPAATPTPKPTTTTTTTTPKPTPAAEPKESSIRLDRLKRFTIQKFEELQLIERTLLECNSNFKDNGAKLGMYLNNINAEWRQEIKP